MHKDIIIRPIEREDHAQWRPLVYWTTQIGNAFGRALYDKVASHTGFIIYSKEL
jgi:hypothetical protein